jgi:hypothetical protein
VPFSLQYYRQEFKDFLNLRSEGRAALVNAFQQIQIVPSMTALTAEVSKIMRTPPSTVEPMVRWLTAMSMAMLREASDSKSFATEVVAQVRLNERFFDDEVKALLTNESEREQFIEQLSAVLNCERSLRVTAKALDVTSQSERVVANSRIITDIRPVFGDTTKSSPGQPLQAILLHTLRLECRGELQHHHFMFSSQELLHLKETLDRALEKEKVLTGALSEGLKLPIFRDVDDQ